jgi:hypothetical protein
MSDILDIFREILGEGGPRRCRRILRLDLSLIQLVQGGAEE